MAGSGSPLRRRLSPKRVRRSVEKLCSIFFFKLPDHDPTESESRHRMAFDLRRRESNDLALLSIIDGVFNLSVSDKDWAGDSQGRMRNANSHRRNDFIIRNSRVSLMLVPGNSPYFPFPLPNHHGLRVGVLGPLRAILPVSIEWEESIIQK